MLAFIRVNGKIQRKGVATLILSTLSYHRVRVGVEFGLVRRRVGWLRRGEKG